MRTGIGVLVVAASVVFSAVTGSAWPGSASAAPLTDPAVRYVALGDSRAAGPYLDPAAHRNGCGRSAAGYPELVAQALRPVSFTNVACTGARTENLTGVAQPTSAGAVPPQLTAVAPDTTLVTVSIGGNDIAWPTLISPCYVPEPGGDAQCRSDPATAAGMSAALATLGPKVTATLAAIRAQAPLARVMLVGHGGIVGSRGCWPNIPVSDADAVWLVGFFTALNQVLAGAAASTGSQFVDVAPGAVGHDACAPAAERWFEGRQSQSAASPLHPNAAGMVHIAQRVLAAR